MPGDCANTQSLSPLMVIFLQQCLNHSVILSTSLEGNFSEGETDMDKLGYDPDSIDDSEMENEVDDSDSPNVGFTYENNGVFAGPASLRSIRSLLLQCRRRTLHCK